MSGSWPILQIPSPCICSAAPPLSPSHHQAEGGRGVVIEKGVRKRLCGGCRWMDSQHWDRGNNFKLLFGQKLSYPLGSPAPVNDQTLLQHPFFPTASLLHKYYSRPGLSWARWGLCSLSLQDQDHMSYWSMPIIPLFCLPLHLLSCKSTPVTTHGTRHTTIFE